MASCVICGEHVAPTLPNIRSHAQTGLHTCCASHARELVDKNVAAPPPHVGWRPVAAPWIPTKREAGEMGTGWEYEAMRDSLGAGFGHDAYGDE